MCAQLCYPLIYIAGILFCIIPTYPALLLSGRLELFMSSISDPYPSTLYYDTIARQHLATRHSFMRRSMNQPLDRLTTTSEN